jgi:regulator of protease activity HflC (stomatin/prohibitin superfamily)
MDILTLSNLLGVLLPILFLVLLFKSIKIVPQSRVFLIERFGKYVRTLNAGLNYVIPFLDRVSFRIDILERQLDPFVISVVTRDNVEVDVKTTVFYRIVNAAKTMYRISNLDQAVKTTAISVIRSAGGKQELDDLQSSRESMSDEISRNLEQASEIWGIEITRTEIVDIIIDEQTKESQRQQLNAERERRARIAIAEGEKKAIELEADALYYKSVKESESQKIRADADSYSIMVKANANAEQLSLIAGQLKGEGIAAAEFEVLMKQVEGLSKIASSSSSNTLIIPSDITKTLGTIGTFFNVIKTEK